MAVELRCSGTLHGIMSDDGQHLEVKCKRRGCGARKGVVVLHTLSIKTGKVVKTVRFRQPEQPPRKET